MEQCTTQSDRITVSESVMWLKRAVVSTEQRDQQRVEFRSALISALTLFIDLDVHTLAASTNLTVRNAKWVWHGDIGYVFLEDDTAAVVSNKVCSKKVRAVACDRASLCVCLCVCARTPSSSLVFLSCDYSFKTVAGRPLPKDQLRLSPCLYVALRHGVAVQSPPFLFPAHLPLRSTSGIYVLY